MPFLDLVHVDGWMEKLVDEYDEALVKAEPEEVHGFMDWDHQVQSRTFVFDLRVVSQALHLPLQVLFKPRMTFALAKPILFFKSGIGRPPMDTIRSLLRLRADATCPCPIWKPGDWTVVESMTPIELAASQLEYRSGLCDFGKALFCCEEEEMMEVLRLLKASIVSPQQATCFGSGPSSHTKALGPTVEVECECNSKVGKNQVTDRQEQGQGNEVVELEHTVEDKEQLEEAYQAAISHSVQDANQYEQSCLVEAIMRSKADAPVSNDGVVVMTLNKIVDYSEVRKALTTSVHLQRAITDVMEAGCEVAPSWTPALLLVPLTQPQVEELGMPLRAHHIVGRQSDKDLVVETLQGLRSKKRPSVKVPPVFSGGSHGTECKSTKTSEDVLVDVVVENTFLKYPIPKDISEASVFAESAPCGDSSAKQPAKLCSANPRRWSASQNGLE
mmetsp:Transcript_129374/g.223361  ORF Transcript_129374/g.223361 Transcript_129374/m.223361 type:complete len:444 (-) Transcript_129374:161-1492(-)